jgi:MFS family permease
MLSAIRFTMNSRFDFPSPLASSLFYLAPGTGFVLGSIIGGILSDRTVKRYMKKHNGLRLPRHRLRAGLLNMLVILPGANLAFGWSLEQELGGIALPAASAFCAGFSLMASFSSINTYAAGKATPQRILVYPYLMLLLRGAPYQEERNHQLQVYLPIWLLRWLCCQPHSNSRHSWYRLGFHNQ